MSQAGGKPSVAIIDDKNLRRASITSVLGPWANSENLRLTSFTPDLALEALQADTDFRMLIYSIGGESIAQRENLQQLKVLRALARNVPLVIISDRDDPQDVAVVLSSEAQGFIYSGIAPALAYQALSFILNGGSYFPPSAIQQLPTRPEQADNSRGGPADGSDSESKHNEHGDKGNGSAQPRDDLTCYLTSRQWEVLQHLRLGESNKLIARRLGMSEGTVKVHIRQLMRKSHASNRTQLAIGTIPAGRFSPVGNDLLGTRTVEQNLRSSFAGISSTQRGQTPPLSDRPRGRPRGFGSH
jgi:DNA-binding NarL/FixJ family response regulator